MYKETCSLKFLENRIKCISYIKTPKSGKSGLIRNKFKPVSHMEKKQLLIKFHGDLVTNASSVPNKLQIGLYIYVYVFGPALRVDCNAKSA